jgi:hypothetical protein
MNERLSSTVEHVRNIFKSINKIEDDPIPCLGGNLNLHKNNITGVGNIKITGVIESSSFKITGDTDTKLQLVTKNKPSKLKFITSSTSDLANNLSQYGIVSFGRIDKNGELTTVLLSAGESFVTIRTDKTGEFTSEDIYLTWKNNRLGLRTSFPERVLDVRGDVSITGPLRLGNFTTEARNKLSAKAGDLIYNTSTHRFQGYQYTDGINFEWVNLS